MSADIHLATYGTLAPGRANAGQLADLTGDWSEGFVRGRLVEAGWGAAEGCPGIVLDPKEAMVAVQIFTSPDLPAHWPRLDAFEGSGYRRRATLAETAVGDIEVSIYEVIVD